MPRVQQFSMVCAFMFETHHSSQTEEVFLIHFNLSSCSALYRHSPVLHSFCPSSCHNSIIFPTCNHLYIILLLATTLLSQAAHTDHSCCVCYHIPLCGIRIFLIFVHLVFLTNICAGAPIDSFIYIASLCYVSQIDKDIGTGAM